MTASEPGPRLILPAEGDFRLADEAVARFFEGADDRVLAAAQRSRLCACVNSPGRFGVFERIARRFDSL